MGILQMIALVLLIFWIGGFALNIAGNLIHILLVLAVVFFIAKFFQKAT